MNYFSMLEEMAVTHHVVITDSCGYEGWWVVHWEERAHEFAGGTERAPTLPEAIRKAYLRLNPIPKNEHGVFDAEPYECLD